MRVRRATAEDIEQLTALRVTYFRHFGELGDDQQARTFAELTERYLRTALPADEFVAWIAEVDGQIVATSGLVIIQRPPYPANPDGREAYLMNMFTLPDWRGKGLAEQLVRALLDYVQSGKAKRMWLHASADGRPLYERLGFTELRGEMELVW